MEKDPHYQESAEGDFLESRPADIGDLCDLCRELNDLGARYLVVGGHAIILAGFGRGTEDVDLLIDASEENEALVFKALESLPDRAVKELEPGEVRKFTVVRVADEIMVDLMHKASGIEYEEAAAMMIERVINGVTIPTASPRLLWRMKSRTYREKDQQDLMFLREYFAARGEEPPPIRE